MSADYSNVAVSCMLSTTRRHDPSSATKVYRKGYSDTFHADKRCPNLLQHAKEDLHKHSDREKVVHLDMLLLPEVLSSWSDPVKACSHCTQPMMECARTAVQQDGLSGYLLCIFERGERRFTTTVQTTPSGETQVSESSKVIE